MRYSHNMHALLLSYPASNDTTDGALNPGDARLSQVWSNFFSGSSHQGLKDLGVRSPLRSPRFSKNGHSHSIEKKTEALKS